MELTADPESPRDRIHAAASRTGVEWEDVEAVLIANGVIEEPTSLANLDDGAVGIITEKLASIISFAQERRAAK